VHFLRTALAHAGKGQRQMVLALINTVFAQDTHEAAIEQWRAVADQLRTKFPKLAALMDDAESDVLAFMTFPKAHRVQIHSTDEIDKCRRVVTSPRRPKALSSAPVAASARQACICALGVLHDLAFSVA
jgi:transposase-like protein